MRPSYFQGCLSACRHTVTVACEAHGTMQMQMRVAGCSRRTGAGLQCSCTLLTRFRTCLTGQLASPPGAQLSLVSRGNASTLPSHSLARPSAITNHALLNVATARHWRASNYPRVNFRMTSAESSLDFQPRGDVPFPFCIKKNIRIVSIPLALAHSHAAFHTQASAASGSSCLLGIRSSLASFEPFRCSTANEHTLLQGPPTSPEVSTPRHC